MQVGKYKVFWRHNNESAKVYFTDEEMQEKVIEMVSANVDKKVIFKELKELFATQVRYESSFSECFIHEVMIDSSIEAMRQEKPLLKGITVLHPKETFNRKRGVYESFKDAMREARETNLLDKAMRSKLWDKFFTIRKKTATLAVLETKDEVDFIIGIAGTTMKLKKSKKNKGLVYPVYTVPKTRFILSTQLIAQLVEDLKPSEDEQTSQEERRVIQENIHIQAEKRKDEKEV